MNARRITFTLGIVVLLAISVFADDNSARLGSGNQGAEAIREALGADSGAIEGTWIVTVFLSTPPPGFGSSFTALETYSRGGGMVTTNDLPPVARPGLGSWKKRAGRYSVAIQFFLFDANGNPAGKIRVRHWITLDGSDEYAGIGEAEFYDLNDNLLNTVGFSTSGRRLKAPAF